MYEVFTENGSTYKFRHRLKDILKGLEQSEIFVPSKKWGHQKKEHP